MTFPGEVYTLSHEQLRLRAVDLLKVKGYRQLCILKARRAKTRLSVEHGEAVEKPIYYTPVGADGAGFPDIYAIKPPRTVVCEIKVGRDTVRLEQQAWLDLFALMPLTDVWILKPDDWESFERSLE